MTIAQETKAPSGVAAGPVVPPGWRRVHPMLLGVVSDIHCHAAALEQAVLAMGEVDELLVAGDLVYEYRFSNEVVGGARKLGMRYVLGNHEMVLLGPHGERALLGHRRDRGRGGHRRARTRHRRRVGPPRHRARGDDPVHPGRPGIQRPAELR